MSAKPQAARVATLRAPAVLRSCLIADSPHSGRRYPGDFNHAVSRRLLRQAEDAYLDRIVGVLPSLGIPLLLAEFPRSYIDPNRNRRAKDLIRLTVSPRHPAPIYAQAPDLTETFRRYAACHAPYHQALADLRDRVQARHGRVVHLNFHSMPSVLRQGAQAQPYDIIIGTREGRAAAPQLAEKLAVLFAAHGYRVGIDVPGFRGAEIIRRGGRPGQHQHALQVEINRALYLDETKLRLLKAPAQKLRTDLRAVMAEFRDHCDRQIAAAPASTRRKPE